MFDRVNKKKKSTEFINSLILLEKKVFDLVSFNKKSINEFKKNSKPVTQEMLQNRVHILSLIKTTNNFHKIPPIKFKKIIRLSWENPVVIKNWLVFLKIMNMD